MENWSQSKASSKKPLLAFALLASNEESAEEGQETKEPPLDRVGDMRSIAYTWRSCGHVRSEISADEIEVERLTCDKCLLIPLRELVTA